eukprot:7257922-Alexandrium_andersonii.AAC.1
MCCIEQVLGWHPVYVEGVPPQRPRVWCGSADMVDGKSAPGTSRRPRPRSPPAPAPRKPKHCKFCGWRCCELGPVDAGLYLAWGYNKENNIAQ